MPSRSDLLSRSFGDRSVDLDLAIMLRVQRDEPGAFAELVERNRARVFGRLFHLLRDRHDAEDLTQEVFLRLYRARHRYRPRSRFNTWLYHIVHNVARNAARSRRRRPALLFGTLSDRQAPGLLSRRSQSAGDQPARPLERREVASLVHAAICGLGDRQRIALELHQFQRQSYAQVAQWMAMTPQAVKSLLYRARHQLRDRLARHMEVC